MLAYPAYLIFADLFSNCVDVPRDVKCVEYVVPHMFGAMNPTQMRGTSWHLIACGEAASKTYACRLTLLHTFIAPSFSRNGFLVVFDEGSSIAPNQDEACV